MYEFSNIKPILELEGNLINGKFFSQDCILTAVSIVKYLCGIKGPLDLPRGSYFPIEEFLKYPSNPLFDSRAEKNLFLFIIGDKEHAFVVEKILADYEYKYIVYQSWQSFFKLDWWLGKSLKWVFHNGQSEVAIDSLEIHAPKKKQLSSNPSQSLIEWKNFYLSLREKYGKGKALNRNEIESFFRCVMSCPPQKHSNDQLMVSFRAFTLRRDSRVSYECLSEIKDLLKHMLYSLPSNEATELRKVNLGHYFSLR